jgi:L-asparaginase
MQKRSIVILGTGGTIAGRPRSAGDGVGYTAAQLGVQALVDAVPALREVPLITEQVAQVDSKDMELDLAALAARVAHHLARPASRASSSPTAPTRWRRRPTCCIACSRRPSRWC